MVEAEPTASFGVLAITRQVLFAIVNRGVMLAGNKKHLLRLGRFQRLIQRVVFTGLGHVAQVACMNDEVGFLWQPVDLVDGRL